MMGTNLCKAAWNGAESVGNRSHGWAHNPRQCSLEHPDCDSCCRGFESHQPPQLNQALTSDSLLLGTVRIPTTRKEIPTMGIPPRLSFGWRCRIRSFSGVSAMEVK